MADIGNWPWAVVGGGVGAGCGGGCNVGGPMLFDPYPLLLDPHKSIVIVHF